MAVAALFLAAIAGFAAQRGSICAVAAVRDVVINRRSRRYVAFLECAAWSLLVLSLARTVGITPSSLPQDYPPGLAAAVGGALFGAGATMNGACTFGSAARLGRGEIAFAAMPAGFLLGVMAASALAAAPAGSSNPIDITASSFAVMGLVFFAGFQFFRLTDAVSGPRDALRRLAAPEWRPSLSMGVIGVSSALLMIFFAPWPYSRLLVEIGAGAAGDHTILKILLAFAFVGGATIGAASRGALKIIVPTRRALAEKAGAGMLMGAGSFFVPGGNDSLVLVGLPHLFAYAIIAYLSMSAAIATIVLVGGRRT
jgi:toxin CptA